MPRDFRTFSQENQKFNENDKKTHENSTQTDEYKKIIAKYKDMNQDDLMSNLFMEANKLKNEGKLDSDTLNTLKSTLTPFLNSEQQNMLNSLINAINEH